MIAGEGSGNGSSLALGLGELVVVVLVSKGTLSVKLAWRMRKVMMRDRRALMLGRWVGCCLCCQLGWGVVGLGDGVGAVVEVKLFEFREGVNVVVEVEL